MQECWKTVEKNSEGIQERVPAGIQEEIPGETLEGVDERIPEEVPKGIPERFPEEIPKFPSGLPFGGFLYNFDPRSTRRAFWDLLMSFF